MEIDYTRFEENNRPFSKLFMLAGMNSALEQMLKSVEIHMPVRDLYNSFNFACSKLYSDGEEELAEKFALAGRKAYSASIHNCPSKKTSRLSFVRKAVDDARACLIGISDDSVQPEA